ncbi:MAG: ABC transporter ATP-binding protein [Acetobacteraceae bacterium]
MEIVLERIRAGYGPITVLHDLSLRVDEGAILGVLGRNGMGKSTLIRCIAGLNPPTAGTIRLGARDITRLPAHERAVRGITTIIQGRGMFPGLTVRENLIMGRIASGRVRHDHTDAVIGYFPMLGERLGQKAGTLSGGEQQMLAIGRALMTEPSLLLLDEPSDGIMPLYVHQIARILARINREQHITMLIVEQNVPMVFALTDHCIILEKGRVAAEGYRAELEKSNIMQEYLAI